MSIRSLRTPNTVLSSLMASRNGSGNIAVRVKCNQYSSR